MTIRLPLLSADPDAAFPSATQALRDPNGLLAMGGDLSPARLLNAYRHGIFPWYSEEQPILWWCPEPRAVFDTGRFGLPSRFRRSLKHSAWTVRFDSDFAAVISACAQTPRPGQYGSWITPAMLAAYQELHQLGHAHSVEVRSGGRLVGGLYGVAIGQMFFGESMFSAESGASKVALAALCRRLADWGWPLLDAQVENPHLSRLGVRPMARAAFLQQVHGLCELPGRPGPWRLEGAALPASALAVDGGG